MRGSSAFLPMLALGFGLALTGCQRLELEQPADPWDDLPEEEGPGTFLPGDGEDDGGALELGCDPVEQAGCDPGQKCAAVRVPGMWDTYACVSDPGGLEPYSPCTASLGDGIDGCPAGYVCLEGAEENGTCVPLCLSHGDCDEGLCIHHALDVVLHCADECSPFASTCVSPMECRRAPDRFVCKFPTMADIGGQTAPCDPENFHDAGCATGFACLPGAIVPGCTSASCCSSLCDVTGPDPCPGNSTCNQVLGSPAPGFEDIGACFIPA